MTRLLLLLALMCENVNAAPQAEQGITTAPSQEGHAAGPAVADRPNAAALIVEGTPGNGDYGPSCCFTHSVKPASP